MYISVHSCLLAKLHTSLDRSTLASHLNCVPHPVCPSPLMSLVSLTLCAPPLPCLWCPSPCLPLPSHVFGVPHPVCPSPHISLVFLTLFASPIPCLWYPLLCLPTLLYLSQPTHLHCMVSSDLSRIFHHLVNYLDHLPLPYI